MSYDHIKYELDGAILTITLNRPEKLNAYTATMGRELEEAFIRADEDDAENQQHSPEFTQWVHAKGDRRLSYPSPGANSRWCALNQFGAGEKITDFKSGGLRCIRAVRAIILNAGAEFFADCAGRSFRGVGRAHGVAPFRNGVFAFQNHGHHFAGAHEFREVLEKWALAVHGVETFSFGLREPQRFDGDNLKLRRVNAADDFAS